MQIKGQKRGKLGQSSLKDNIYFESAFNVQKILVVRIQRSRNQGVEKVIDSLSITPSDPLGKFLFPVPANLSSAGLDVLVLSDGLVPAQSRRCNKYSTELENQMFSYPFWVSGSLKTISEERNNSVIAGGRGIVIDPLWRNFIFFSTIEVSKVVSWI